MRLKLTVLLTVSILLIPAFLINETEGADPPTRGGFDPNDPDDGDLDPDGDGLSNREEAALGTNPDKADSDNDMLPDGYESYYGLDPLSGVGINGTNGNPDGDGWTNIQEYNYTSPDGIHRGTDPMDPNTDDDEYVDDASDPFPLDPYNGKTADTVVFLVNSTGPKIRFRTSAYGIYNGMGKADLWSTGDLSISAYTGGIIWDPLPLSNSSFDYNITFNTAVGSEFVSDLLPFIDDPDPYLPLPMNTESIASSDPQSSVGLEDSSITAHDIDNSSVMISMDLIVRRYQVPADLLETANSSRLDWNLTAVPVYLQRNGTFDEVLDLASEITKGQRSDYLKAMALSEYLHDHYAYDDSPLPVPAGRDQVQWTLMGQRSEGGFDPNSTGYGDLRYGEGNSMTFATSLAVMCRLLNISSRFVMGYESSEENPWNSGWIYRGKHLRAWVECHFDEIGWIEFDPSPDRLPSSGGDPPDREKDDDDDGIPDYIELGDGFLSTHPLDHDNDGTLDGIDPDDDDDGIADIEDEQPLDHDNDGLHDGADDDDDNDGMPDHQGYDIDRDGDGTADYEDDDRDGDGIPDISDISEGGTLPWGNSSSDRVNWRNLTGDLDGDGILNEADRDQDGDGILDVFDDDDDNDGVYDPNDIDDDNDGIRDSIDFDTNNDLDDDLSMNEEDSDDDGDWIDDTIDPDDDNDGIWDWFDPDDDNDGVPDIRERGWGGTSSPDLDGDLDDDNIPNEEDIDLDDGAGSRRDDDGDGVINTIDIDDDGDGIPDPLDLDTDNDLDNDGIVNELDADMDNDTVANYLDQDDDNDGIPDMYDNDIDNDGNGNQMNELAGQDLWPLDHDNDGTPDFSDDDRDGDGRIDSDGDGLEDVGTSDHDHDDDGLRDDRDRDDDEDGVTDLDENDLFPRLMRTDPTNPWDHDNDGIPDDIDPDDDGDGRSENDSDSDRIEEGYTTSDWDGDNDGIPDSEDKIPTRVAVEAPGISYLGEKTLVNGSIELADGSPGGNLIVAVHINYTIRNQTGAVIKSDAVISSNPIQADGLGKFSLFLYPLFPSVDVGSNMTYSVSAEVHDLFFYRGSWSDPSPMEIRSKAQISVQAPEEIISGEEPLRLMGKIGYKGSTMGVASANLTLSFLGRDHPFVRSNATGNIDMQYDSATDIFRYYTGVDRNATMDVGEHEIGISYQPDVLDQTMEYQMYLDPAEVTIHVRVVHRTEISANATLPNGTVHELGAGGSIEVVVGQSILIRGVSDESWDGVKNPLVLTLGKRELMIIQPASNGRFSSLVTFDPPNFEAGDESLSLSYVQKEFFIPINSISIPVRTIGTTFLVNLNDDQVYRGGEAAVSGRLISNTGRGIPYQQVSINWKNTYQFYTETDGGGWFAGIYQIPRDHELGTAVVNVSYLGSGIFLPTISNTSFDVVSGSFIRILNHTSEVMRGEGAAPFILSGFLMDDNATPDEDPGQPLESMTVHLVEDRTIISTGETDASGLFSFNFRMPITQSLGNHTYHVVFNGSGGYLGGISEEVQTAVVSETFMVIDDIEVVLDSMTEDQRFRPESFRVSGKLTDDIGEGVFLSDVTISVPGLGFSTSLQTDSFGGFSHRFTIGEHVLGSFGLNGTFPGVPYRYRPSTDTSTVNISTFPILNIEWPEYLERNSSHSISGKMITAGGMNLADAEVMVGSGDVVWEILRTNSEGIFSYDIEIPISADTGPMRIWTSYSGSEYIDGYNSTRFIDLKAGTTIIPMDLPVKGPSSSPIDITFRLVLDNGSILEGEELALEWGGGIVSGLTDETGIAVIQLPLVNDTLSNRSYRVIYNGSRFYLPSEFNFNMDRVDPDRESGDGYFLETVVIISILIPIIVLTVFMLVRKRLRKVRSSERRGTMGSGIRLNPRNRNVAEVFRAYREYAISLKGLGAPVSDFNTVREDHRKAESIGISPLPQRKRGLLEIFEEARYSMHDITDEMVASAKDDAGVTSELLKEKEADRR